MSYNISEGLENGMEDFARTSKLGFGEYAGRIVGDPNMGAMMTNLYASTFWNLMEGCYHYHCSKLVRTPAQVVLMTKIRQSEQNEINQREWDNGENVSDNIEGGSSQEEEQSEPNERDLEIMEILQELADDQENGGDAIEYAPLSQKYLQGKCFN